MATTDPRTIAAPVPTIDDADLPPIIWATPEESRELFDMQAQALMGMSGEEFMQRWDAGEYREIADTAGHLHIMRLASFMSFGRLGREVS
ncbi:MAG: hypothetical protein ACR2OO_15290 [Thermomicrobiales bacterium]